MLFGLSWFSRTVYSIVSRGRELQAYTMPQSDTMRVDTTQAASLNRLYVLVRCESPDAKCFYFTIPMNATDIYRVSVVHKRGSYYRTDNLFFDRYTLAPLQGTGPYAGRYNEVSVADRLMRMNLEIHDGRIWVFVVSLLCAWRASWERACRLPVSCCGEDAGTTAASGQGKETEVKPVSVLNSGKAAALITSTPRRQCTSQCWQTLQCALMPPED